ncbi:MAG: lysine--tRNA ligase, partial [Deltaproteobacteria bacterium]
MDESSRLLREIKKKVQDLRARGLNLYPSGFRRDITVGEVIDRFGRLDGAELEQVPESFTLAGR